MREVGSGKSGGRLWEIRVADGLTYSFYRFFFLAKICMLSTNSLICILDALVQVAKHLVPKTPTTGGLLHRPTNQLRSPLPDQLVLLSYG